MAINLTIYEFVSVLGLSASIGFFLGYLVGFRAGKKYGIIVGECLQKVKGNE